MLSVEQDISLNDLPNEMHDNTLNTNEINIPEVSDDNQSNNKIYRI